MSISSSEAADRFLDRFLTAYGASDFETLADCYEEEAVYMPAGRPALRGRQAIERHQRAIIAELSPEWRVEPEETLEAGDLLIQRGRYFVRLSPGEGESSDVVGKYLIILRRQPDGSLKLLWDMDNDDGTA